MAGATEIALCAAPARKPRWKVYLASLDEGDGVIVHGGRARQGCGTEIRAVGQDRGQAILRRRLPGVARWR
jgi:hypothetical protein